MKLNEAIEILRSHNEWRRGAEIPQTDPKTLGEAIDCVVGYFADVSKSSGIEERAKKYTDKVGILGAYLGYIAGATEQKKIDIDKACEWLGYCLPEMEYITNASALRQKKKEFIESFRKAMEVGTCNSDKNLQELTWQDIKRIVEIADDDRLLQHCSENGLSQEQYYTEVLKEFNKK